EKNWKKPKEEVVIDLKFSKERTNVGNISPLWFLIPVGIALVTLVVGLSLLPILPEKIPSHWDLQGNLDGYMDKNKSIWFMPIFQLAMTGIFFFTYKVTGWSKQQVSLKNSEESVRRNIIFRRVWSIFYLVSDIIINFIFYLISFHSFDIIDISMKLINILFIVSTLLIMLG